MFYKKINKYISTFLLSSLLSLSSVSQVLASNLIVNFIDIGQGDSELIQLPDGKNILIDAGDREASQKLLTFFKDRKIKKLDLVIISHPHLDHYGGLLGVIKEIPVTQVYDSGAPTSSTTYLTLLKKFSEKKTKFTIVRKGQDFNFSDNIKLKIISPEDPLLKNTKSDANNASIVAKLTYNKVSFLFTGDIENEVQEKILSQSKNDLKADILKVAHHGSRYTSSKEFLDTVNPKVAVISSGQGNSYNHPHQETLERLSANKIKLYRTDMQGDIVITSNGETYDIKTNKSKIKMTAKKSKTDLNKANSDDLELLPNFNSDISKKLVSLRPIKSWSDLNVLKLNEEQIKQIKSLAFFSKISKDELENNKIVNFNGKKVNINTATKAELVALPAIGDKIADKIIAGRPFKNINDIKRIPGMNNRFKKFSELITI